MCFRSVLFIRTAVCNMRPEPDERRAGLLSASRLQGLLKRGHVVAIPRYRLHKPAVRLEPLPNILTKGKTRSTVDADMIVVVDSNQVVQSEMTRQRTCFRRDSFLHITVATDHINIVV